MPDGKEISLGKNLNLDLSGALSTGETWMVRTIAAILLIFIIYAVFSNLLYAQMDKKEAQIDSAISAEYAEIEKVSNNTKELDKKTEKYKNLIADLKRTNQKISDAAAMRNSIPNLLNQIMSAIPNKVQLTSIENTKDKNITIKAQSTDYDQLGYFIATIKVKNILNNVVSTSGLKSGGIVTVTIEGELP